MLISNRWVHFWITRRNMLVDAHGLFFRFCWRPDWEGQEPGYMVDCRWAITGGIGVLGGRPLIEFRPVPGRFDRLLDLREAMTGTLPELDGFLARVVDSSRWTGRIPQECAINLFWGFNFRGAG